MQNAPTTDEILALVRTYATEIGACQSASEAQYAGLQLAARATFAKIEAAVGELEQRPMSIPKYIDGWLVAKYVLGGTWSAAELKGNGRREIAAEIDFGIERLTKSGRLQRLNFGRGNVRYELRAVDQAATQEG